MAIVVAILARKMTARSIPGVAIWRTRMKTVRYLRGGEGQCIKNPATTTGGTKKQIRQPGSGQQARRALLVARESFYFDV